MSSIIVASGFVALSQRNRLIDLGNKYNELDTRYESLLTSQTEAQRRLESEIVYETLKIALIEERMPTFPSLTYNTSTVVLSTELIEDVNLPRQIGGYRLLLLNPEEIETRAETEGAFLYLRFTRFEPNPDNILISIRTAGIFDAGGGITIQFKLTGTIYQTWIS
jgi:hypothetical protein